MVAHGFLSRSGLPSEKLICSYVTTIGTGVGATGPAGFTFTSPTGSWFYVVATCDGDGVAAVNASYFFASNNATIQVQNEGR